jgi:hypothetical protein
MRFFRHFRLKKRMEYAVSTYGLLPKTVARGSRAVLRKHTRQTRRIARCGWGQAAEL